LHTISAFFNAKVGYIVPCNCPKEVREGEDALKKIHLKEIGKKEKLEQKLKT
jgi:hypothetical protein